MGKQQRGKENDWDKKKKKAQGECTPVLHLQKGTSTEEKDGAKKSE